MKKNIIYTDAPKDVAKALAAGNIVADFLPPPEMLIRKQTSKATAAACLPYSKIAPVEQPFRTKTREVEYAS